MGNQMRKTCAAIAVGAFAIGLVATSSGIAETNPRPLKRVGGSVSVNIMNPIPASVPTVSVSGSVSSPNDACRKGRTVHFTWINSSTGAVTPQPFHGGGPHGNYNAGLYRPPTATLPATFVLQVTAAQRFRQVRKKKESRGPKINCLEIVGSTPVTFLAPPP